MAARNIIILTLVLSMFIAPRNAAAAKRALLMFDNFTHWVDFNYLYSSRELSDGNKHASSHLNRFQESYGFMVDFAIYNPRIINGMLQPGIRLEQRETSNTTDSNRIAGSYNLTGNIFDRTRYASMFYSSLDTSYVHEAFVPSYSLTTSTNGYSITFRNKIVPVQLSFNQTSTETSGMTRDMEQETRTLSLSANNNFRNIAQTSVGINWFHGTNATEGLPENSRDSVGIRGSNSLKLSSSRFIRTLTSSVQADKTENQNETELLLWNETLLWNFGRALSAQLEYNYTKWATEQGTEKTHRGSGSIHHTLFDSVTTEFLGTVQDMSLIDGTEHSWLAGGGIRYQKKLPKDSIFDLFYHYRYGLTDRKQTSDIRFRLDEPHTVLFGTPIYLVNPNVDMDSVVVRSADSALRPTPYIPGTDYELRQIGLLLEIVVLPGSTIRSSDNLLVSYNYHLSPNVSLEGEFQTVGSDLWLFGNEYRIYGRVDLTQQTLLEGNDDGFVLNNGHIVTVGMEDILQPLTYQVEYEGYRLDLDNHDSILGRIQYTRPLYRATFIGNIYDRFTHTRAIGLNSGSGQPSYSVNTTGIGTSYIRNLLSTAFMTLSANYYTTHGSNISRDDLSLRFDFRWNYGKLQLQLFAQTNWRFEEARESRDDNVHLVLRRYL